jgi:hypothetical protein
LGDLGEKGEEGARGPPGVCPDIDFEALPLTMKGLKGDRGQTGKKGQAGEKGEANTKLCLRGCEWR